MSKWRIIYCFHHTYNNHISEKSHYYSSTLRSLPSNSIISIFYLHPINSSLVFNPLKCPWLKGTAGLIFLVITIEFIITVTTIEFAVTVLTNNGLQCKLLLKLVCCDCRRLKGKEKAGDRTTIAFLKSTFESVHHGHGETTTISKQKRRTHLLSV